MTDTRVMVAVCGAHMSGLPLNGQLLALDGRLAATTATAEHYRLYHLVDFSPPRPGLLRVDKGGGSIALEVWEIPLSRYGALVAAVPAPLCIGRLELADGVWVQGFLCESYAVEKARDITSYGGWRQFLAAGASA